VKPLEMICEERQRSVLHFAQCRREEWPVRNLSVSLGGTIGEEVGMAGMGVGERWNGFIEVVEIVEKVEDVDSVLSVEDCRDLRRKGTDGRR
jgi:hypothetical protein